MNVIKTGQSFVQTVCKLYIISTIMSKRTCNTVLICVCKCWNEKTVYHLNTRDQSLLFRRYLFLMWYFFKKCVTVYICVEYLSYNLYRLLYCLSQDYFVQFIFSCLCISMCVPFCHGGFKNKYNNYRLKIVVIKINCYITYFWQSLFSF